MLLKTYLKENRLTQRAFAERIQVTEPAVRRYVELERIPRPEILARIEEATKGKVRYYDFVQL